MKNGIRKEEKIVREFILIDWNLDEHEYEANMNGLRDALFDYKDSLEDSEGHAPNICLVESHIYRNVSWANDEIQYTEIWQEYEGSTKVYSLKDPMPTKALQSMIDRHCNTINSNTDAFIGLL